MVALLRKLSSRVGAKAYRRDWGGQFVCGFRVRHLGASARPASRNRVWKTLKFRVKMSSFIHRDGYFYGLNDGILACIDARDGSPKWKEGRYGHGQILLIGDLLLVTAENGEIILLAPTPEAPNELTRFHVFSGKTWNPSALSGDLLLMRTDQEAACLRLPLARQP